MRLKHSFRLTIASVIMALTFSSLPFGVVEAAVSGTGAVGDGIGKGLDNNNSQALTVTNDVYSNVASNVYSTTINAKIAAQLNESGRTVVREDTVRRTRNSKHYLMSDGSYKAVITFGDQNYEDESGHWQDIDTTIVDEADLDQVVKPFPKETAGMLKPLATLNKSKRASRQLDKSNTAFRAPGVPFDVSLPKKFVQGYSIGNGADKLKLTPVGAQSVVGTVYDNEITYANAWISTDVKLSVQHNGLKESITVKDSSAPSRFSYEVNGKLADDLSSGALTISPAWLVDAQGTQQDVKQQVRIDGGKTFIDVTYDASGLVFPVLIDPTITVSSGFIQQFRQLCSCRGAMNYPASTAIDVGVFDSGNDEEGNFLDRGLLQINQPTIASGKMIRSAAINIYSSSVDNYLYRLSSIILYKVTQSWDQNTVTWSNKPPIDNSWSTSTDIRYPQYYSWDITTPYTQWYNGTAPNFGFSITNNGQDRYDSNCSGCTPAYLYISDTNKPQPYITVDYNDPPSTPTVLTPSIGSVVDGVQTISWNASADSETLQNQLQYEIQLSTDGGTIWPTEIVSRTNAGATTYNYDFTSSSETSNAYIRVRAYDSGTGAMNGDWGQSAPFIIRHNHAPYAPGGISPGSASSSTPQLVAGATSTLNWIFSDPDAGNTQSAYDIIIKDGTGASTIYDSGWVSSSATTYTVPAGILNRGTTYSWQVSAKDNKGAASPYSTLSFIKINNIPSLSLTSYADGQQVADNVLTFTWTYADSDGQGQASYQVLGSQDNWATVGYNSGVVSSPAASHTTPPLASGLWSFKVLASDGLEWSTAVMRNNLTLPNAYEPNDTNGQAFSINYGQNYSSLINSATDMDFYKYTATATGINRLVLNVPTGLNYDVYIYDANMNLIATGAKGVGLQENVLYDVTNGNTYYVKIFGVGGNYSTSATYSFTLSGYSLQFLSGYQYDSNGNIINKTTTKQ